MNNQSNLFQDLENLRSKVEGVEFWSARDLQKLFEYKEWCGFENIVKKAVIACKNSSENVENYFVSTYKMVEIGSNTQRELSDYALTRYAWLRMVIQIKKRLHLHKVTLLYRHENKSLLRRDI
ncbi:hypothetical protein WAF17_22450 (plasmid) [Bernardetia sp. ABR2-2B]|uniref:hypothetical protein n=1 Tax=Bernardetia sp. ABR2-2B TaxID=3127472 RepID=UPI0030D0F205